jgi:hypothetical protein
MKFCADDSFIRNAERIVFKIYIKKKLVLPCPYSSFQEDKAILCYQRFVNNTPSKYHRQVVSEQLCFPQHLVSARGSEDSNTDCVSAAVPLSRSRIALRIRL